MADEYSTWIPSLETGHISRDAEETYISYFKALVCNFWEFSLSVSLNSERMLGHRHVIFDESRRMGRWEIKVKQLHINKGKAAY